MFINSRSTNGNPRKNTVIVLIAVLKITLAKYCNDNTIIVLSLIIDMFCIMRKP